MFKWSKHIWWPFKYNNMCETWYKSEYDKLKYKANIYIFVLREENIDIFTTIVYVPMIEISSFSIARVIMLGTPECGKKDTIYLWILSWMGILIWGNIMQKRFRRLMHK